MKPVGGRFVLTRRLSAGTYGEVFLGLDLHDDREVVVKVLHANYANSEVVRERFRREAKALERLKHPHVVRLIDAGTCEALGRSYLAMERVAGPTLAAMLRARTKLSVRLALRVAAQVLEALDAAHRVGIVHRDLKPENLIVSGSPGAEHVVVLDFGLAKHTRGEARDLRNVTGTHLVGSPTYMSPEQCRGETADAAADVYAVGCVLMECLTGSPPFLEPSAARLLQSHALLTAPKLDERWPEAPPVLTLVVESTLSKLPGERPSVTRLRERVLEILDDLPAEDTPQGPAIEGIEALRVGATLAGWPLEAYLGRGRTGYAFRTARGRHAGVLWALRTEEAGSRQVLEVAQARRGWSNGAVPEVWSAEQEGDWAVVVEEATVGQRWDRALLQHAAGGWLACAPWLRRLVTALEDLHRRGMAHGDLRPDTIWIDGLDRIRFPGFGFPPVGEDPEACVLPPTPHSDPVCLLYMPPEWAERRETPTPVSDVYQLGALLYYALCGRPPYEPSTLPALLVCEHTMGAPPPWRPQVEGVPEAVGEVVLRCLEVPTARRWQNAFELGQALEPLWPERPSLTPKPHAQAAQPGADDGLTLPPGYLAAAASAGGALPPAYPVPAAVRSEQGGEATLPPAYALHSLETLPPGTAMPASPPRRRGSGRRARALPDSGDAVRCALEVEHGGRTTWVFVLWGTRLRFGRDRGLDGSRINDLVLRSFRRGPEPRGRSELRTQRVSKRHGTLVATLAGPAVRDEGSRLGTELDGKPLPRRALVGLPERFELTVAAALTLSGRVCGEAVALERPHDGPEHRYVWAWSEFSLGSGEDALRLEGPGVVEHHARLRVEDGEFVLRPGAGQGAVFVDGLPTGAGEGLPLEPGQEVRLGDLRLRVRAVRDEDMKPSGR